MAEDADKIAANAAEAASKIEESLKRISDLESPISKGKEALEGYFSEYRRQIAVIDSLLKDVAKERQEEFRAQMKAADALSDFYRIASEDALQREDGRILKIEESYSREIAAIRAAADARKMSGEEEREYLEEAAGKYQRRINEYRFNQFKETAAAVASEATSAMQFSAEAVAQFARTQALERGARGTIGELGGATVPVTPGSMGGEGLFGKLPSYLADIAEKAKLTQDVLANAPRVWNEGAVGMESFLYQISTFGIGTEAAVDMLIDANRNLNMNIDDLFDTFNIASSSAADFGLNTNEVAQHILTLGVALRRSGGDFREASEIVAAFGEVGKEMGDRLSPEQLKSASQSLAEALGNLSPEKLVGMLAFTQGVTPDQLTRSQIEDAMRHTDQLASDFARKITSMSIPGETGQFFTQMYLGKEFGGRGAVEQQAIFNALDKGFTRFTELSEQAKIAAGAGETLGRENVELTQKGLQTSSEMLNLFKKIENNTHDMTAVLKIAVDAANRGWVIKTVAGGTSILRVGDSATFGVVSGAVKSIPKLATVAAEVAAGAFGL